MGPMFGDTLSGQFGASVTTESTMFGGAPAQACEAPAQLQPVTGSMFSSVTGRSSRGSVSLGQHKLSSLIMGEEDGKAEQTTKQLPCVTLTLAQNADGSFPVTEKVTGIMNLELIELLDHGKPLDPRAWMTLVCIAFLMTDDILREGEGHLGAGCNKS